MNPFINCKHKPNTIANTPTLNLIINKANVSFFLRNLFIRESTITTDPNTIKNQGIYANIKHD